MVGWKKLTSLRQFRVICTGLRLRRHLPTLLTLALALLVVVWFFTLRPAFMGGPASYITVSGVSMEPTYTDGDLVVMRKQGGYEAGDIIAYRIPAGELGAGSLVIHRVVGQDDRGYITRGDNRNSADLWRPADGDVLGSSWVHIPASGSILSQLRAPLPLATIAAALAAWVALDFGKKKPRGPEQTTHRDSEYST